MEINLVAVLLVFAAAVRLSVPIALAGIGATLSERAGVLNLGLEGMLLTGAFAAVATTWATGNPWWGVLGGIVGGMLMAWLLAVMIVQLGIHQAMSGIIIMLLGLGITTFLTGVVWGHRAQSDPVATLPTVSIPYLSQLPQVGVLFAGLSPILFMLIVIVIAAQVFVFRTSLGRKLSAVGENPDAAQSLGIRVQPLRFWVVIVSGALTGLGGAFLSISQVSVFSQNMSAGRGWIGLVAAVLGRRNPALVYLASLVFALGDAMQWHTRLNIPDHFLQMLPYVITLVVITTVSRRVPTPEALGRPFGASAEW